MPRKPRHWTTEPDGQLVWDFSDRGNLARQLAAIGITDAEVRIVLTIWERGELKDNCSALAISTRALAERIGLARSWVVEVLNGMIARKIIRAAAGRPKVYLVDWTHLKQVGQSAGHHPTGVNDLFSAFEIADSNAEKHGHDGPVNGPVDGRSDGRSDGPDGRSVGRQNRPAPPFDLPTAVGGWEGGWIEEENKQLFSLSQSFLRREISLPLEIWTCRDALVAGKLQAWWREHRPADVSLSHDDALEVLGAILAARHIQAVEPVGYVATCLRNGVRDRWRAKAKEMFEAVNAYAPH